MKFFSLALLIRFVKCCLLSALVMLSGCGNTSRYFDALPNSLTLSVNQSPQFVTDFSHKSTDDLYNYCLGVVPQSTERLVNSIVCTHALLARDDVSLSQRQFALGRHRNALMRLLILKLEGLEDRAHLHTGLDLSVPIILASRIKAREPSLQPKVLGDYGIAVVVRENDLHQQVDSTDNTLKSYYPQEGEFRSYTLMFDGIKVDGEEVLIKISKQPINERTTIRVGRNAYLARYSPSAAYVALLNNSTIDAMSWKGFVGSDLAEERRGVYAIGPLSDTKIPLIMIHGLNSDPLVWRYLSVAILNDEWLNERYQLWHVLYPTGQPPFYNAMKVRRELNELLDNLNSPLLKREAVYIGHSMGGLISKLLTTESGSDFWQATFAVSKSDYERYSTADIDELFFFSPLFERNTVFFLDTPHKGSALATSTIGYIGNKLVSLPVSLTHLFDGIVSALGNDIFTPSMRPYIENTRFKSLDVLAPGHPLMDVLYNKRVQGDAYAVIGSSSEIECDTPTLCSLINDGVVNYDSAFTPDALETIIVNSRHNSFKSPQAVDFIVEHLRN